MNSDQRITRSKYLRMAAGGVIAVLLLITAFAQPTHGGIWQQTFGDFLHVPVFGIVATCLLLMSPPHWSRRKRLLFVFGLTFVLGALTEIAQIPTARDASLADLASDMLGAAGFVAIAAVFSRSISIPKGRGRFLVMLGLALLAWPVLPVARVSTAYLERNQALPALVRFDNRLGHVFFRLQNADIRKIFPPGVNSVAAEISLKDGPWPGIIFHDIWPNWEPYSVLAIEVENPTVETLPINLSVHDRAHRNGDQPYSDRFNRSVDLAPGSKTIRIELADIRNAPAGREMNMAKIDGLAIFCTQKEAGRQFVLYEIRLE